ncbi:MAG: glycoside hydrolase family 28 protein [Candidatus Borkfalkiaceae bacterium]|nr:glycoside hydrolase family 28 protein [Christensenellaceae bacterium]
MYNILQYGAVGDGVTKNTSAIQRAVDDCFDDGGGTVYVPAGRFLTGTVVLKSNVELRLSGGAVLLGSTKIADYLDLDQGHPRTLYNTPILSSYYRRPLIYARDAENVAITGMGTIDGQSGWKINFPNEGDATDSRPILIIMNNVKRLRITDVTLKDPSMWTTRFERCEDVVIRGVTVRSMRTNNGDGLDFAGGKNIRISDCDIEAGDDCISLKMFEKGDEIRNVSVTNCILKSWWCGFRIGGETDADCREVTLSNCVVDCSGDGIKIHSCGGSVIENMNFSDVCMKNVERPVFMVADIYTFRTHGNCRPEGGVIRNIRFSNITSVHRHDRDYERYVGDKIEGSVISGSFGGRIENVTFDNLSFEAEGGVTDPALADPVLYEFVDYMDKYAEAREFRRPCVPASGLYLRRVKGCSFRNVRFSTRLADVRPRMIALHCEDCDFEVSAPSGTGCPRPFLAEDCGNSRFGRTEPSPFTEDEKRREKENSDLYYGVWKEQKKEAETVDAARRMPEKTQLKFEKTEEGGTIGWTVGEIPKKAYVYFAWAKGNADFFCNGRKIGSRFFPVTEGYKKIMVDIAECDDGISGVFCDDMGDRYDREYYCAFDVTDCLKTGRNVVEIKGERFLPKWEIWYLRE